MPERPVSAAEMTVPKGLGNRGRALWRSVAKGLGEGWELDEREVAILTLAARQADDLANLEQAIKHDGAMSTGSQGQPVVNPAIVEARQARLAIGRLLGQLALPDEAQEPRTEAGKRGQRAARARWGRRDQIAARRRLSDG
jgi:phage terminase small subunit